MYVEILGLGGFSLGIRITYKLYAYMNLCDCRFDFREQVSNDRFDWVVLIIKFFLESVKK